MKLIIDIPDRIHYGIKLGITVNGSDASQMLIDAVKNGILLDKIRAEIEQIYTYEHIMFKKRPNSKFTCVRLNDVLQIIDKYRG